MTSSPDAFIHTVSRQFTRIPVRKLPTVRFPKKAVFPLGEEAFFALY
jgi:hypothetical protein